MVDHPRTTRYLTIFSLPCSAGSFGSMDNFLSRSLYNVLRGASPLVYFTVLSQYLRAFPVGFPRAPSFLPLRLAATWFSELQLRYLIPLPFSLTIIWISYLSLWILCHSVIFNFVIARRRARTTRPTSRCGTAFQWLPLLRRRKGKRKNTAANYSTHAAYERWNARTRFGTPSHAIRTFGNALARCLPFLARRRASVVVT